MSWINTYEQAFAHEFLSQPRWLRESEHENTLNQKQASKNGNKSNFSIIQEPVSALLMKTARLQRHE